MSTPIRENVAHRRGPARKPKSQRLWFRATSLVLGVAIVTLLVLIVLATLAALGLAGAWFALTHPPVPQYLGVAVLAVVVWMAIAERRRTR